MKVTFEAELHDDHITLSCSQVHGSQPSALTISLAGDLAPNDQFPGSAKYAFVSPPELGGISGNVASLFGTQFSYSFPNPRSHVLQDSFRYQLSSDPWAESALVTFGLEPSPWPCEKLYVESEITPVRNADVVSDSRGIVRNR